MAISEAPSQAELFDLLKRVLVARIRLDAADVFDEALSDYCEYELKLSLSILDSIVSKSPSSHAFLELRLGDA
ncbi:hypothetical protein [Caballeronia sp. NK8]|uniref:hypothetical protein n=1 Tax=Caballeronia sp. NK8 TaxID=140098 RepID=UPI001BCBA472|nr:hypothetical protein [Caballeronia sp. NK8]